MKVTPTSVVIADLVKRFGPNTVVDIPSLGLGPGELMAVSGHSGCGKTTLLRLIAGLEKPTCGTVRILQGREHQAPGPAGRGGGAPGRPVGMVFQHPVLMPHLDVRDNLAMGWRLHYNKPRKSWWEKTEPSELRQRLDEALELLELQSLSGRMPAALSGGQRQRVALGRCLVRRPAVFLLDEPLASLDPELAARLRERLRDKFQTWGSTVFWVSHDAAEGAAIAGRRIVLCQGRIIHDSQGAADLPDGEANALNPGQGQ
jgi:ABC-type sugar transport system ATPase subunit